MSCPLFYCPKDRKKKEKKRGGGFLRGRLSDTFIKEEYIGHPFKTAAASNGIPLE